MGVGLCARGSKGSGVRALCVQERPASIGAGGGALGRRNVAQPGRRRRAEGEATAAAIGDGNCAGVNAHGVRNRRGAGLGNGDSAWIACAREGNRTTIQSGPLVGDVGANREGRHFSTAKLPQKLNYGQELVNTKVVEDGPSYNFHIGTFL